MRQVFSKWPSLAVADSGALYQPDALPVWMSAAPPRRWRIFLGDLGPAAALVLAPIGLAAAASWQIARADAAAIWLGAGIFAGAVVRAQGKKAKTLPERVMALRIAWRLANVYSLPGGIVAGILGFGLLHPMGYGFRPGWVHASIGLWVLMLANGIFYLRPSLKKLLAAAEASAAAGAPTAELQALAGRKSTAIAADLNALGFVLLTLLMVLKPF